MTSNTKSDQKSYHHGDLRRVIIETALQMLKEQKGWQFTLREVARRADVSHSAPYRHFPDKATLLRELALIGFDQLLADLQLAEDAASTTAEQLKALAHAYLSFGAESPDLYRLMFAADAGEPSSIHADPRALAPFQLVIHALENGQRVNAVRRRSVLGQATACWAHLHGLTTLSIDGRLIPAKVGDNAVEEALTTLLDGLVLD